MVLCFSFTLLFALQLTALYFLSPLAGHLSIAAGILFIIWNGRRKIIPCILTSSVFVFMTLAVLLDGTVSCGFDEAGIKAVYGTVIQDSVKGNYGTRRIVLSLEECFISGGACASARGVVNVTYSGDVRLYSGDRVLFYGLFNDYGFNATHSRLLSATTVREKRKTMLEMLERIIDPASGREDNLSLMLLSGCCADNDFPLSELARESGTSYVLALSGMHLSVFSLLVQLVLSPFLGRRNAHFISILTIAFYVFYIGPKASILRAFILSGVLFVSKGKISGVRALFITFTLHSLFFPLTLLSLASCYSYLSLLGIMSLSPVLKNAIDEIILLPESIVSNISAGATAILFTSPLSYCVFGTYQLSAVITGGLISALVYLYMVISLIPYLFPLRKYVYFLIESLMDLGARFPQAETMVPYIVFSASLLLLILLSYILKKKRRLRCGTLITTARKK